MEQKKVHLQGIGQHKAKPAHEFRVGDAMVWNYGYVSHVVAIEAKGAQILFTLRTEGATETHTRRKGAGTLIAYTTAKPVLGMTTENEFEG